MTDRKRVAAMMQAQHLPLHGICAYADVAESLLPCRGRDALRDTFEQSPLQSVIAALFPYRFAHEDEEGNLARYARVPDYHMAAGEVLADAAAALRQVFPSHRFLSFIDNSPLPEVKTAALAGLGCIGDNGLLIHPVVGSWVFIGTIVTDLPLPPDGRTIASCPHCGACTAACPGGCIDQSHPVHRDTCLSRVSQKKGALTAEEAALIRQNGMVWGCDRCQEVCPLNREAQCLPHPCFGTQPLPSSLTAALLEQEGFLAGKAYAWRGAEVLRRNLSLIDE